MNRTHRQRLWAACAAALVFVCFVALSQSRGQDKKQPDPKPGAPLTAKLSGFSDAGVFHTYKDEEILIRNDFTWKDDGSFESKSVLEFAGQKVFMETTITPDKDGRWSKIEGKHQQLGKYTLELVAGKIKKTTDKKSEDLPLKDNALLFDDNAPALMSLSVRAYDQAKGGKQKLMQMVIPATHLEATLERKETVERSVGGKDLKLTVYDFTLGPATLTVWADAAGKIYLSDFPPQKVAFVREGYESLRSSEIKDLLLSKPEFTVKEESNVRVAMRDGIKLATDIYRPDKPGKYPGILIRTPYKKEMMALSGKYYARRGYTVAIQDCRGRFSSEGPWEPFVHEPKDGFDSVEWLAAQPSCTGKVGMIGASYVGWVQWWAAVEQPPHLVTIIPNVSPPDPFYNFPYEYGVFFLAGAAGWVDIVESGATADLSGESLKAITEKKYVKLLNHLPVIDLDKVILGKENPYWRKWIEHPTDDKYWEQMNFHPRLDKVKIPVFHQSGWFDGDGIGSKLNYAKLAALGHANQKLTLGPWGHTDTATRTHGDHDFGPAALHDLQRDYLRWFDYWLKGVDNGVLKEPLVSIFVMNSNKWLHGPAYPLPQTRFDKWYLASGGKANTSTGDGKLTREPPPKDAPQDKYSYDPGDPTPSPTVAADEIKKEAKEAAKAKKAAAKDTAKDTAKDQSDKKDPKKKDPEKDYREDVTKARRDLLVYVSEPMAEEYTFAGPVSAVLYASSSAKDTDWFIRLLTVDPKGEVFELVTGKIRARFRESMAKPTLLEPGKVYEYKLDLWQTGISVPKGHKLRVEVSSAAFPLFSRNLNTGGHNEMESKFMTAEQTIYHDERYPSHILLPMIPVESSKAP